MNAYVFGVEFVVEECINKQCGISFAMTRDLYNRLQKAKESESFYCPRGHRMWYTGKTEEQKLRDKLAATSARETAMQDQLAAAIRDREASNQQLIKERSRFAAGLCPCCTRTFSNVARHMETQHPDYDVNRVKAAAAKGALFTCSCGDRFDSFRGLRTHQGWKRQSDGNWAWDSPSAPEWARHLTVVGS